MVKYYIYPIYIQYYPILFHIYISIYFIHMLSIFSIYFPIFSHRFSRTTTPSSAMRRSAWPCCNSSTRPRSASPRPRRPRLPRRGSGNTQKVPGVSMEKGWKRWISPENTMENHGKKLMLPGKTWGKWWKLHMTYAWGNGVQKELWFLMDSRWFNRKCWMKVRYKSQNNFQGKEQHSLKETKNHGILNEKKKDQGCLKIKYTPKIK